MTRKPTDEEIAQYLHRVASLETYGVLPARIAIIVSSVAFLWPVIVVNVGAKQLVLFRWVLATYALLSVLYSVYVFVLSPKVQNMALTKGVALASVLSDNVFLGFLLYVVMMEPLGHAWVGARPEASLFWVYCGLVVRNTFLFPRVAVQTLVNSFCIFGYVSALLLNIWGLHRTELSDPAARELLLRVIVLFLVSICSSAIYTLRGRQLRRMDEAHERTVRSLRLDMARMLAAQVAHELKNPLSIMKNAAFLLRKSGPPLDGKAKQQVDIIEDEITRADQLISQLLDYARLAEGRIDAVEVNGCIDECLTALKHELEARRIEVEKDYWLDMPFLFIDRGQLKQVFTNLILNGSEAIEKGGKIRVSTSYSRDGFIEVSISDTGKGMPPDVLSNVFKPFFTTKEKGTGMGLSIVRNVARAYRGEVTAESRVGAGTTFRLRFPTRMALQKGEGPARSLPAEPALNTAVRRAQA